jgi:hypothetical protein
MEVITSKLQLPQNLLVLDDPKSVAEYQSLVGAQVLLWSGLFFILRAACGLASSSSKTLTALHSNEKCLYVSYLVSTVNALLTVYYATLGIRDCPHDGTLFTEEKCLSHVNQYYLQALTVILSYSTFDLFVIVFLI